MAGWVAINAMHEADPCVASGCNCPCHHSSGSASMSAREVLLLFVIIALIMFLFIFTAAAFGDWLSGNKTLLQVVIDNFKWLLSKRLW